MSFLPLRVHSGSDLRQALEAAVRSQETKSAFVVAGIGSLVNPRLRLAGEEAETSFLGAYEIICLSGTLSPNGAHLHIAIADNRGGIVGGHVCYGNEVRTTAEVLLANLSEWNLTREFDAETGYHELVVASAQYGSANAA